MKSVLKLSALFVATAGATTSAMAAPEFYLGAQAGYLDSSVEISDSTTSRDVGASYSDVSSYGFNYDSYGLDGVAGGIFAGVKFGLTERFYGAVELNLGTSGADAEFSDYSEYSYSDDFGYSASGSRESSQELEAGKSYGIGLLAGMELTSATRVYAKLGYQQTEYEYKQSWSSRWSYQDGFGGSGSGADGDSYSKDEDFGGVRYGLGMETDLTDAVAMRLEWTRTDYSSEDVEAGEDTFEVSPEESLLQVGVSYRF